MKVQLKLKENFIGRQSYRRCCM